MFSLVSLVVRRALMMKINYDKKMWEIIDKEKKLKRLLLHSCCAPCSSACLEKLTPYFDITILYYNLFNNDTAYFILSNSILLISILLFYYYFSDYYLSLIFTFLTLINSICMSLELKKISLKHFLLSIPYLLFNFYFLNILIFKL